MFKLTTTTSVRFAGKSLRTIFVTSELEKTKVFAANYSLSDFTQAQKAKLIPFLNQLKARAEKDFQTRFEAKLNDSVTKQQREQERKDKLQEDLDAIDRVYKERMRIITEIRKLEDDFDDFEYEILCELDKVAANSHEELVLQNNLNFIKADFTSRVKELELQLEKLEDKEDLTAPPTGDAKVIEANKEIKERAADLGAVIHVINERNNGEHYNEMFIRKLTYTPAS